MIDVEVAGVMHTQSNVVGDALDILRSVFAGPLIALPWSADWSAREVIGRPVRGFLAASPSFFLLGSSLLRAAANVRCGACSRDSTHSSSGRKPGRTST